MADELDSKEESTEDTESEEVETEESEDESTDEQASEESQDEETSEEGDDDNSEPNAFDKRFTQFKGDTPEEYAKNLEEAYANSTNEAIKLRKSLAEAQQPQGDPQNPTTQTSTDPALIYARQQMEEKQSQEFDAFAKDHPEIESDPEIAEKMTKRLATLARTVLAEDGRVLGMAEGLSMAWSSLNLGNNQQENTRMAAKVAAATSKTASAKKNVPKAQFTTQQLEVAKKMGLTEKDLLAQIK